MSVRLRIGVVGTGYVGLVTGACLAYIGHWVSCIDQDEARIRQLKSGMMPIYEPKLQELVVQLAGGQERAEEPRLSFAGLESLERAVREVDALFIAVGTPLGTGGSADLTNVADVARQIGQALGGTDRQRPLIIVNKSTVPVGSGDYVSMLVEEGLEEILEGSGTVAPQRAQKLFKVVSNPEFLKEGSAIHDTLYPDRIVLGSDSVEALEIMNELYKPVIERNFEHLLEAVEVQAHEGKVPCLRTDLASAEMIKYAANAFLATKISFINEVANICELVGADVERVSEGIGLDERIGPRFLKAGIGWGGSCFPKDVLALKAIADEHEYDARMLSTTVSVNQYQRKRVIGKLQHHLRTLKGKRVALLGLSFKPNTDDLREAPSLEIARTLVAQGVRVVGYDPVSGKAALRMMPELRAAFDPYEALEGAHAAVLVTEWEEFRDLNLSRISSLMQGPRLFVDGRNLLDPREIREAGLLYEGFGRV